MHLVERLLIKPRKVGTDERGTLAYFFGTVLCALANYEYAGEAALG